MLGPEDQLEVSQRARRARALAGLGRGRESNAWLRLNASLLAALISWVVLKAEAAPLWALGLPFVILADRAIFRRLRLQCEAGAAPQRTPWLIAWLAAQSCYGNALGAILWFSPYDAGHSMALMFLCGSLANAAATLRTSAQLSAGALTPTILYLLALPSVEFALGGCADPMTLAPLFGIVLLLLWGVQLWRSLLASDLAQARAEGAAMRERQATAAALASRTDTLQRVNDELRTPMAVLAGAAEHLHNAAATPLARAHVANLARAADLLQRVLADLADLDALDCGAVLIEPAPTRIADVAQGVVSGFRVEAQRKNLELFLDLAPDLPACVEVDALRLKQILANLVSNAVRHTQHGGVRVAVCVDTADRPDRVRLRFTVSDTGKGLSRAHRGALFSGAAETPGRGLAIAQRLARAMGGRIEVKSDLGHGSEFVLVLDTVAPASARDAA